MTEEELRIVRRAFARQIMAVAGVSENGRLEAAFSEIRRERFLGSDQWMIVDAGKWVAPLPENDPVYAYQDVLFALSASRGVNNGEPSLHARMLNALSPEPGQLAVHVGAGTGYYTAVLAELVGPRGHIIAIEIDPILGSMARENLRDRTNVDVVIADGGNWPQEAADRIYVNFAVTGPPAPWIERLSPMGRLVMPLGVPNEPNRPGGPRSSQYGGAFLIERRENEFAASYICPAYFIDAEGDPASIDEDAVARLELAFRSGRAECVKSLVWGDAAPADQCWYSSPEWSLSYTALNAGRATKG